jgi:cyclopropane fatty-acyl-phospholipid synthase-like methyltransferase
MTERWETLAQEDAEFYIWTDVAHGDDFYESGERDVDRILAVAGKHIARFDRAMEMGCGIGRLTLPMSRRFGSICAVDIAPTMTERLRRNCEERSIGNVQGWLAGQSWEQHGPFDFAYSRIVFQHIADWDVIADYFKRIAEGLAADGVFYVQFDTRPPNSLYRVRNALPDALLPRHYRSGVRRIRRTTEEIVELARTVGLDCRQANGQGTDDTELLFGHSSSRQPRAAEYC